jgi:hypothetical protein
MSDTSKRQTESERTRPQKAREPVTGPEKKERGQPEKREPGSHAPGSRAAG